MCIFYGVRQTPSTSFPEGYPFREDHLANLAKFSTSHTHFPVAGLRKAGEGGNDVENVLLKFLPLCTSNFYTYNTRYKLSAAPALTSPPAKKRESSKVKTHTTSPKSSAHPVLRSTLICLKIIFIRSNRLSAV